MRKDAPALGSKGRVHRLTDMLVEEVSFVDKAANKRKWLMVKRDQVATKKGDGDMGAELIPDGKGGFTSSAGIDKGGNGAPPDPKKKKPGAGGPTFPSNATGTAKGAMDVPPGFKQVAGPLLEKVAERVQALADSVDGATEAAVGDDGSLPGVPPEFAQELGAIIGLMEKLGDMFPGIEPDMETAEGEGGELADAGPADLTMGDAQKFVGTMKAQIQKLGAKMSKDRLARYEQALNVLGSLLGELRPIEGAPPAPALGKKVQKSTEKDPLEKQVEALTATVSRLVDHVVKQDSELSSIKKARVSGNGQSTIETGGGGTPAQESYSWPLDMNRPFTRENVEKGESFFGDD